MNEKLNIQDLIDMLATKHGMNKKDADSFVRAFFQLIEESLEQDKYVKIRGLGTFKLINVGSRESINVNTRERIEIQGHTKVSFTPEPALKNIINRPFSCFESVVLNEGTVLEDTPLETENEEKEETESEIEAGELEEKITLKENGIPLVSEEEGTASEESPVKEEPLISEEEPITPPKEEAIISKEELIVSDEQTASEETEETKETEVPQSPAVIEVKKKEEKTMRYFMGIVVLVVLLCGAAIAFIYSPDLLDKVTGKAFEEELAGAKKENVPDSIYDYKALSGKPTVEDSLNDIGESVPEDTVSVTTELKTQEQMIVAEIPVTKPTPPTVPEKKVAKEVERPVVPNYDSSSYEIIGTKETYTIKEGDMLTRIALHYYGTKLLWPYIVKHNPTVIKNPNNVPCGTTIKIPKLVKKQ